jgi:hypothetical protein
MPEEFECRREAAAAELRHALDLARCALRQAAAITREPLVREMLEAAARVIDRAGSVTGIRAD